MRSVPEWIGQSHDSPIPPRVRLRIFERFGRSCACCGRPIRTGEKWDLDHSKALANGGEHRESNLQPMLAEHHKRKTKDDVALKSWDYRKRLAQVGIKRRKSRPMFGSRDSGWKITFNRGTVRR